MSDNEDDDDDSEDEDEDDEDDEDDNEEEEEEDDDDDPVNEEELKKKKLELVNHDIMLIKDIFKYIDQTSKRIVEKFTLEREIAMKTAQVQRKEQLQQHDNPDLSWAQYENLDEAQRAELLEKAIMVLAQDN